MTEQLYHSCIGRPLKFKSPEDMENACNDYFKACKEAGEPLTITGLALAIGLNRQSLCNYEKKDGFVYTVKKAKQIVEYHAELRALKQGTSFDIFRLKNLGWTDKSEIEHGGKIDSGEPVVLNIALNGEKIKTRWDK